MQSRPVSAPAGTPASEDQLRVVLAAVAAADAALTISDARLPDNPLVYVNPAFERSTGYDQAEVLGRNCRFLQGAETDPVAVRALRKASEAREHVVVTLLNYRKDGTPFWNELSVSPVHSESGELTHFVGIQADVTVRVLAERERDEHLAAERAARAAAEKSERRLGMLAEATAMLAATLDVDESLRRLTELVVPLMADWCTVQLLAQDGEVQRVASTHVDPAKKPALRRLEAAQPDGLADTSLTAGVLRGGPPALVPDVDLDRLRASVQDPELLSAYLELGFRSAIVVPLRARRQVLGALTMMLDGSHGRRYDTDDLQVAADLARRAALTVDNARLYQREHSVAEQLQRSLLPQLGEVPGLDVAARYLPSSKAAQVGGDWYDLFAMPDGVIGLAIGDVMGHDLTAAAAMGQLRSVLRSYAWQGGRPATVLDHLDQLVQGLHMAQLATTVYARLTLPAHDPDTAAVLQLSNAGHLPPVLRTPDGCASLLTGGASLLVGAALGTPRTEIELVVPRGSLLVLFTDGLVEQRGLDPDAGLERLRLAVEAAGGVDAEAICDQLLTALDGTEREDDVALLVVRLL